MALTSHRRPVEASPASQARSAVSAVGSVFTEFVRVLEPGAEPPESVFDRLWISLKTALAAEVRRRGLWEAPPSYLGVLGSSSWETAEALEELAAECFSFIFVDRLRGLKAQLGSKPSVDGLVFVNIRHFVHDLQRKHDPLGYRVFELLHEAVRRLLAAGGLQVWRCARRVRNATRLGFGPPRPVAEAPANQLREAVDSWVDEMLPDIVLARAGGVETLLLKLGAQLASLRDEGVEAVRFKSLVDPLKSAVRARWAAALESGDGFTMDEPVDAEGRALVARLRPHSGFEERQSFDRLVACVQARIDALVEPARDKVYLTRLFACLVRYADDAEPVTSGPPWDELPSQRRIARLLDIPRDRLRVVYQELGRLFHDCGGRRPEPRPATHADRGAISRGKRES